MRAWISDTRVAIRGLRRSRAFTLVALATFSMALALNIVMFSVLNAIRHPELPYRDPAGIVSITEAYARYGWTQQPTSLAALFDLRSDSRSFTAVAVYSQRRVSLSDGGAVRLAAAVVSSNLWSTLGVEPVSGRGFTAADDERGAPATVMIGHRIWVERFASAPDIAGRTVTVDGTPRTIVGVMPAGLRFPEAEDLWLPLSTVLERDASAASARDARGWGMIARLRPGVSVSQVNAELRIFGARTARAYPQTNDGWTIGAMPIAEESFAATGSFFGALQAAALLLAVIMCSNLGNLLLARGEQRRREMAIRTSLGAPRARLLWLALSECLVLAAVAVAIALVVAAWGIQLVPLAIPEAVPFYIRFRIDAAVVLFAGTVAGTTALVAGLGSAIRAARAAPSGVLTAAALSIAGAPRAGRLRSAFLFVQMCVASALLASTFVVALGVVRFHRMDLGFDPSNTLMTEVPLSAGAYERSEARRRFAATMVDRLAAVPGVDAAAVSSPLPLAAAAGTRTRVERDGETSAAAEFSDSYIAATPAYFRAVGIPVLKGRAFSVADGPGAEPVTVINVEAAQRLFGDADPVGRRIRFGRTFDTRAWRTIVGVVPNITLQPMDPEVEPRLYVPFDQDSGRFLTIAVRAAGAPERLASSVVDAVRVIDPDLATETPATADQRLANALWPIRFFNGFAAVSALFGMVVAAAGVYGLSRYLTLARTREIGVRLALGATPRDIGVLIVRQSSIPVIGGVAAGLACSVAISALLNQMLVGVPPFDPLALGVAAAALFATAIAAVGLPARGAVRVEPVVALRQE